jgi:polyketide biosynthesis enoyl-CoA hydratase PksI
MASAAVEMHEVAPCIVQLTMQDRNHKNMFSKELLTGLVEAFRTIQEDARYRVVIVTGYDNYFCLGGTREELLALHEGKREFVDAGIVSLLLDCEIPVISAMQGHGIGGGFVFGLFADCVVLSRESVYSANFMKYGFTPGMGATYILPKKLGLGLAEEMLFSARSYRGADLEQRGAPFPVVPRSEVIGFSHQLAREIADKPRLSLVTLKNHLVGEMRSELPSFIAKEVAMHAKTLHQPEVRERIDAAFGR